MIYGYCRCSTNESKQDINRQKRELKELGASEGTMYWEYQSGTKFNRPELTKLLNAVQPGDTIVTTEVSRITRSTKQLCEIIEVCKAKQLKLVIKGSVSIDCSSGDIDPMTEAFLQMAGVFAQLERDITVSRIRSGISNARAKGKQLGRPKLTKADIPQKLLDKLSLYESGSINKTDLARLCDISRPTLNKYLDLLS